MVRTFVKRPIQIEAMQWYWGNAVDLRNFVCPACDIAFYKDGSSFELSTLRGEVMICEEGDWIIKGVEGEFYVCPDSVFQKTYSEVLGNG